MPERVKCPLCLAAYGGACEREFQASDLSQFNCAICGRFQVTGTALDVDLNEKRSRLTPLDRAGIMHRIRTGQAEKPPRLDTYWIEAFVKGQRFPTPAQQAINALRFVGDEIRKTGKNLYGVPDYFFAIIGAPNPDRAHEIAMELIHRGLLSGRDTSTDDGPDLFNVGMKLGGWERYEAERRGTASGGYGFLAMKFGDQTLDAFVRDVLKPAVREALKFEVVDMRDIARAGIIDNIMRAQIRDAAFVLVDLTHDNSGAYWEAGYAEGLGKEVIYICEKSKFDKANTHFDTNHSTTVAWSVGDPDTFKKELIATIRRSLNLFAS